MMNTPTERIDKEAYKNYVVTKSNKLIHANYDLSLNELKIMLVLASRIQPNEDRFHCYSFKASELAELLQITPEAMYMELPKITRNLLKKIVEIQVDGEDDVIEAHLLSASRYRKKHGIVVLEFSSMLAPYLLELKENFTNYRLENVLVLNSKYSIRMYEMFKSHFRPKEPFFITVSELRKQLQLTQKSYEAYSALKIKVIDVAVKEITEMTDLNIRFESERVGRKVENLYFYIEEKASHEIVKKQRKLKGKRKTTEGNENPPQKELPKPKKPKQPKKESKEPFVDYIQSTVKKKTKKYLPKKDARLIAKLVNEDMSIFGPVLPYLHNKLENPTGFIIDFLNNPAKYASSKPIIRKETIPPNFYDVPAPLSEEEKEARIKRMRELQDKILNTTYS